jgi:uncharacterized metal-binding protein YceD (DUF177 family)
MIAEPPFSRLVSLSADQVEAAVGFDGVADDERAAIAELLGIAALDRFALTGRLVRTESGLALDAKLRATVVQPCVVTFEPVAQRVAVAVERRFVVGEPKETSEVAVDPEAPEVDHVAEPTIDLGAVAVEELSLALDPYPRAADADAVAARYGADDDTPAANAFAALARRRLDA